MNFRHANALESLLETAGYPPEHAVTWSRVLLDQVNASPIDNALIGFLFRSAPADSVRDAIKQMPEPHAVLCYARMVAFGMTVDEIRALMPPQKGVSDATVPQA